MLYMCAISLIAGSPLSPSHLHTHTDKDGEPPHYEPLVNNVNHDFAMKLDMLSNPNTDQRSNQQHKAWHKTNRKSTKYMQTATTLTGPAKTNKRTTSKNKITT